MNLLTMAAYLIACISMVSGAISRLSSATTSRPSWPSPSTSKRSGPPPCAQSIKLKGHNQYVGPEDGWMSQYPFLKIGSFLESCVHK